MATLIPSGPEVVEYAPSYANYVALAIENDILTALATQLEDTLSLLRGLSKTTANARHPIHLECQAGRRPYHGWRPRVRAPHAFSVRSGGRRRHAIREAAPGSAPARPRALRLAASRKARRANSLSQGGYFVRRSRMPNRARTGIRTRSAQRSAAMA